MKGQVVVFRTYGGAGSAEPPDSVAAVVIDTNVVLDWLLFCDAGAQMLGAAVESGQVRWVVCARMREEFAHVLRYPALASWAPDDECLLDQFDRHAVMQPDPTAAPTLRCTDADDQVFLDLAMSTRARWLVSHDRAVLRLARRAQAHGLAIVRPGAWALPGNLHNVSQRP